MQEFPVVWLKSIVFAFSFSSPRLPWHLFPFFIAFGAQRDLSSSILHFILRSHTTGGVFFNLSLSTAYSQKKELVIRWGQVVQAQLALAFVNKSEKQLPTSEGNFTAAVPISCALHHTVDRLEHSYLLILHVARVRHLLGIYTKWLALRRVHSNDAMVYHVLQVGKASPNVRQLIVRVVTGPREPNP